MTKEIKSLSKRVESKKEESSAETKSSKKKIIQMENKLKNLTAKMTAMKMQSTFMIGLFAIVTVSSLGNYFQGIPVARLPFEPIGLFRPMTHRGLGGEDYTECSYILIYMLSSFILRQNIQKIFGFEGAKMNTNLFMPPGMQA